MRIFSLLLSGMSKNYGEGQVCQESESQAHCELEALETPELSGDQTIGRCVANRPTWAVASA